MKELELSAKDLAIMAKVIAGLSDLYDNEESAKGCYECHDIFKLNVQRTILSKISRDIRDDRIAEIVISIEDLEMHRSEDDDED